jgi:hypothetical protein
MSAHQSVERDERRVAVENASYKWAYTFIIFALLIDVMYRGAVRDEAAWDLMALIGVGGIVSMMYQARQKTAGWGSVILMLVSFALCAAFIVTMYVTGRLT